MKQTNSGIWIPDHLKPARKFVSVCFWFSRKLNRIQVGLPEQYPVPYVLRNLGFEKIVCKNAYDVDRWSQKLRDQEKREAEMTDEARHEFEAPLRAALRKDLVDKMLTSKNAINRDFCKAALDKMDAEEAKWKTKRESFQHVEGYEDGK